MSDEEILRRLNRIESGVLQDRRALRSLNRVESGLLDESAFSELHRKSKEDAGITIFVPNWNHKPYLPRSIRSALDSIEHLKEAGFSVEILVIDDASRDGSQKFLRSIQALYREPRLKTLLLKRNLGLPRLRNLGLRMSRFRYVCLLDADNELIPSNLPLFANSIAETGAAVVYGNLVEKQGNSAVKLRSRNPVNARIFETNQVDAFSVVDAEKLLRVGGYASDPQLYGREDREMILHLISEEEKIVFVPGVLGYYHVVPLSMLEETKTQAEEGKAFISRVYAQSGPRRWESVRIARVYHPAVGYIENW
jgi:glycosyltransferase involved in cell wall biosynthesis